MAFAVTPVAAKDGTGTTIAGGVDFVDTSGTGAGPWIIGKVLLDPLGVNVQYVLSNNAAKMDLSSVAGTTAVNGHGTAAGALRVELPTDGTGQVNAIQSGSWTVTANAGTNLNTSALALESGGNLATVASAVLAQSSSTSGEKGILAQGAVTTAAPTYSTGNTNPLSLTTGGALRVDASAASVTVSGTVTANQGGAPWSNNVTQFGGVNVSTGTGASGTGIPRVTVANDSNILATQSGNWTARIVGNGGATLDAVVGAATSPTNMLAVGGVYHATELSPSDTQSTALQLDSKGRLREVIMDAAGNTRGMNVDANNRAQVLDAATSATAAAVPANAAYAGAQAITALPTAVSNAQEVGISADKFGRPVVLQTTIRDLIGTQTTTISASTSETTIVTAAASTFNDLLLLIVSNTSASTVTRIDFRDTTAGSVLFSLISNGGQNPVGFNVGGVGIPQTSVNTNWTAQCATSTTDIRIYAVFAKNK